MAYDDGVIGQHGLLRTRNAVKKQVTEGFWRCSLTRSRCRCTLRQNWKQVEVMMRDVVIVAAVRTPIGAFGGSLASVSSPKLGLPPSRLA